MFFADLFGHRKMLHRVKADVMPKGRGGELESNFVYIFMLAMTCKSTSKLQTNFYPKVKEKINLLSSHKVEFNFF